MDITIVIPVYNRKDYIRQAVENIDDSYRLILVDNNSADGSWDVCLDIAARRQNTVVVREYKKGAAAARNKGLSLCETKWIYFFDSDDVFTGLPDAWNEDADVIYIPTRMKVNGRLQTRAYKTVAAPYVQILSSMYNTHSMIFSTDYLRRIGGWNELCMVWNDWELGIRVLLEPSRIQWLTSRAYHEIFIHSESITGSSLSSRVNEIITTLGIVFDEIASSSLDSSIRQKSLEALFYRCYIISGKMRMEGNEAESSMVRSFIYERFRVNKMSHSMGRLFEWASAKGVRGVWRIALRIV